jgi:hypothetical protein
VHPVNTAPLAEFLELQPGGLGLLVLVRVIVAALALGALQNDVIERHFFFS